tara:strand:+ start:3103 stop:3645 length:543 start_codon:yes stop_codon:yes gene_type:complete
MKVEETYNPEDPLSFDLPKLLKRGGAATLQIDWNLQEISTTYSEAHHLGGELRADASGDKVVVSGELNLGWSGPCRRCLDITSGVDDLEVSEIYEPDYTDGETFEIPLNQILDLRPMLQELILLALPLTPLCSHDCRGPIPEEYPAGSPGSQGAEQNIDPPIDPRWEALGALTFEEKESN